MEFSARVTRLLAPSPTQDPIERLLHMNARESVRYTDPGYTQFLRRYRSESGLGSEMAFDCSDGRSGIIDKAGVPPHAVHAIRNIGCVFDIGWSGLFQRIKRRALAAHATDLPLFIQITSHYSASQEHLGCRGHGYNRTSAQAAASLFAGQITRIFEDCRLPDGSQLVTALPMELETDEERLTILGPRGERIACSPSVVPRDIHEICERVHPNLAGHIARRLQINDRHAQSLRGRKEPRELDHCEWVLAVGNGFLWICVPNTALIVSRWDPQYVERAVKAAGIVHQNLLEGRIPSGRCVLLACEAYESSSVLGASVDRKGAIESVAQIYQAVWPAITTAYPLLEERMIPLLTVLPFETVKLEVLPRDIYAS